MLFRSKTPVTKRDLEIEEEKKQRSAAEYAKITAAVEKARASDKAKEGSEARWDAARWEGLRIAERQRRAAAANPSPPIETPQELAARLSAERQREQVRLRGMIIKPTRELSSDTLDTVTPPASAQEREIVGMVKDAQERSIFNQMESPKWHPRMATPEPEPVQHSMGLAEDPVLRARAQRAAGQRAVPASVATDKGAGSKEAQAAALAETANWTRSVDRKGKPIATPPPKVRRGGRSSATQYNTSSPSTGMGPRQTELVSAQRAQSSEDRQRREEHATKLRGLAKENVLKLQGFTGPSGEPVVLGSDVLHDTEKRRVRKKGGNDQGLLAGPVGMVGRRALFDAHLMAAKQLGTHTRVVENASGRRQIIDQRGRILSDTRSNLI